MKLDLKYYILPDQLHHLFLYIPILNSAYRQFRIRMSDRFDFHSVDNNLEMRRLNQDNLLIEQNIQSIDLYIINQYLEENRILKDKIQSLEKDILNIKKSMKTKNATKKVIHKKNKRSV